MDRLAQTVGKVSRVSARPSSTTVPAVVKSTCAGITEQAENSLFHVVTIDTTGRTPEQSFDEILLKSEPMVTFGELALAPFPSPAGSSRSSTATASAPWSRRLAEPSYGLRVVVSSGF